MRAVADIQRLGLFPAVFAPPPALQAALGGGFGAPCAAVMAAADALLRTWAPQVRRMHHRHAPAAGLLPAKSCCHIPAPFVSVEAGNPTYNPQCCIVSKRFFAAQEPFSPEERRLALLAALLLPLRAAHAPPARKKGPALPASSHIVREALKWRTRDAEAVIDVHGAALELLRLHTRLRVPRPALKVLWQ